MTDNILAIIILPLLLAIAIVGKGLRLISDGVTRVARLFGDKGASAFSGSAEEDLLS